MKTIDFRVSKEIPLDTLNKKVTVILGDGQKRLAVVLRGEDNILTFVTIRTTKCGRTAVPRELGTAGVKSWEFIPALPELPFESSGRFILGKDDTVLHRVIYGFNMGMQRARMSEWALEKESWVMTRDKVEL